MVNLDFVDSDQIELVGAHSIFALFLETQHLRRYRENEVIWQL